MHTRGYAFYIIIYIYIYKNKKDENKRMVPQAALHFSDCRDTKTVIRKIEIQNFNDIFTFVAVVCDVPSTLYLSKWRQNMSVYVIQYSLPSKHVFLHK